MRDQAAMQQQMQQRARKQQQALLCSGSQHKKKQEKYQQQLERLLSSMEAKGKARAREQWHRARQLAKGTRLQEIWGNQRGFHHQQLMQQQ
jgi:hypothetical protein